MTATVRKLAHYTRVNNEVIADITRLQVVGTELLSGLIDEENQQFLTGHGGGTQPAGPGHRPGRAGGVGGH